MQESGGNSWDTGVRATKTSEDRYVRSGSSSSHSSMDEPIASTRSNIYNSSIIHQQMSKPDYNRVFIFFFPLIFFIIISILFSLFILRQKLNH